MKILICDDHELFRDGLAQALPQLDPEAELVHAATAAAALEAADAHPDLELALVDFRLPDGDGLAVLEALGERLPALPVVMISSAEEPDLVRAALDGGAAGFVPKSSTNEVVLGALRLVLAGDVYVPRLALGASPPASRRRGARRQAPLTARQLEVARLLARGLTNREIGSVLSIAQGTVKAHVAAILEALDVSNRTESVMMLRELGLDAEGADEDPD